MPTPSPVLPQQRRRFVSIVGLSDERRIPRLGRIRLGHVNHNTQSSKSYPEEDPFFHVPEEVARVYGENPTELDVMFPVNDRSIIFPQAYEYYGNSKRLLCSGDGREAIRWDTHSLSMQHTECPCDLLGESCKQRGHLLVMLPKVRQTGVYQIDTSSNMSIIGINSFLHMLAPEDQPEMGVLGYFAMVPLKLRRVPRDIYPKGYHRKSYPIELVLDATEQEIRELRAKKDEILLHTRKWAVQVPEQSNPEQDTGAIITIDGENPGESPLQQDNTPNTQETPSAETPPTDAPQAGESIEDSTSDNTIPADTSQPHTQPIETPSTTAHPRPPTQTASLPSTPTAQAPVRTLRPDRMTGAQRTRILVKTRGVKIPDTAVDEIIRDFTKTHASDLINRVDAGDFSAFDRRHTQEVPLPTAS